MQKIMMRFLVLTCFVGSMFLCSGQALATAQPENPFSSAEEQEVTRIRWNSLLDSSPVIS